MEWWEWEWEWEWWRSRKPWSKKWWSKNGGARRGGDRAQEVVLERCGIVTRRSVSVSLLHNDYFRFIMRVEEFESSLRVES